MGDPVNLEGDIADGFLRFSQGNIHCAHCGRNLSKDHIEKKGFSFLITRFAGRNKIALGLLSISIIIYIIYTFCSRLRPQKFRRMYF